ncbi:P27 family phage terminase small subunit [Spirosoma sp. KNUC1025]|uniref:P27 family phage terminase small subunit n=1 Tax=Spirosoma sp. KNUC1025 TaxID=2894082 RepID=UPI00386BF746|nr:P27 family phage terminase small subunit [Spirosoma sp. KNUC1025]
MASAGRPHKSDEEKELQGTFRQDRKRAIQAGGQPVTLLAQIPDPPERFADDLRAQYQWQYVCEELFNLGMLRPIMLDWIELYCAYLSDSFRFRELAEHEDWVVQFQNSDGQPTYEGITKYATLADKAFDKAQQTLKLLCLDPATVRKLSPVGPEKAKTKIQQLIDRAK